jgi:hypothetical protein
MDGRYMEPCDGVHESESRGVRTAMLKRLQSDSVVFLTIPVNKDLISNSGLTDLIYLLRGKDEK